jgi:hypothetical protein
MDLALGGRPLAIFLILTEALLIRRVPDQVG